ncbi:MAG: UBP-type zinc finger domain-containing protein [Actinomycetota bacterium]|nr:UBP-type zinc finger domain-containing protein [Actinomycetota bacterium]
MADECTHLDAKENVAAVASGCVDYLRTGGGWVHLRRCLACGNIGCCDNSPGRYATAHFDARGHPVMQSFEPGEDWLWCYVDDFAFEVAELEPSESHS